MEPEDIKQLAEHLAPMLDSQNADKRSEFYLDPEKHYNDHKVYSTLSLEDIRSIRDLARLFVYTKGLFWKAFLGFAIVGAVIMAAVGMGFKTGSH